MDKKSILISSVVIALAATMLFATIATPALAAKKFVQDVDTAEFDAPPPTVPRGGAPVSYPCEEEEEEILAHFKTRTMTKTFDDGTIILKTNISVYYYYVEDGERIKTGQGTSTTLENAHTNDLPYTFVSKVVNTCIGVGQVSNTLTVVVTIGEDLKVSFSIPES